MFKSFIGVLDFIIIIIIIIIIITRRSRWFKLWEVNIGIQEKQATPY